MKTKRFATTAAALILSFCVCVGQSNSYAALTTIDVPGADALSFGEWNPTERVFRLTSDVQASLRIVEDGLTLDGNGHAISGDGSGSGVVLTGRTGVVVNNAILVNLEIGIELVDSNDTLIRNSAIGGVRVGISCTRSNDNVVADNLVQTVGAAGISCDDCSGNVLIDNTVEKCGVAGILLTASQGQTVAGNTVSECHDGMFVTQSGNNEIKRNQVTASRYSGIVLYDACLDNTVSGNTCSENRWGIFFVSVEGNVARENTCDRNFFGIYLSSANGNTIEANTCRNNNDGIYLRHSSSNQVTDNQLEDNTFSGLVVRDSSNENTIEDNSCVSNNDGLYLRSCRVNVVKSNLLDANTFSGIVLTRVSLGNQIEENDCSNNRWGVYCSQSNQNTLTGNVFLENDIGFYAPGASYGNTLTRNSFAMNATGVRLENSGGNRTYNNDFVDNPTPAVVVGGAGNVFHLDKPVGGNFWDTWTAPDGDGDGFVDFPLLFAGGQDDLPAAGPFTASDELTWPGDSALTVVSVGLTDVALEWTPAEGEVETYILFQDGAAIATLDDSVTACLVADLEAGTTYTFKVEAANPSFQTTDGPSVVVQTLTPLQAIEALIQQVKDLDLPHGITTGFLAMLNTAKKILSDGEDTNDVAAVNTLKAFVQHLQAQSGKKIDEADARSLQEAALEIIEALRGA